MAKQSVSINELLEVARDHFRILDTEIYTAPVNRAMYHGEEDWWIGIYTNPNCRDGGLGNVPLGTPPEQIRAIAIQRMKLEASICRDARKLEATGKMPSAAGVALSGLVK